VCRLRCLKPCEVPPATEREAIYERWEVEEINISMFLGMHL
jgi:hypothetical protein